MLTQFFDYLGSIINYAAVGGAILYLSQAEGRPEAEIAALVARGSYSCLYLIDAFSQVLTRVFAEIFLVGLGFLQSVSYVITNPQPTKNNLLRGKVAQTPLFNLIFPWVRLDFGWGVRRFHDDVYMFSNPT